MNILVTGGKGYVGSTLTALLEKQGHDVSVYDLPHQDIRLTDDIKLSEHYTSVKCIKNYIKDENIEVVYHLAALAELLYTDEHPGECYDVNIEGTKNVIEACGNKVLLNFISTSCIYGNPLETPSREDSLINPSDTYAHSKASGEHLVKLYGLAAGLRYNILRLGTVYGHSTDPKMRGDMCIQRFLEFAINGQTMTIDGSGKQNRNFIHIDDLAEGLAAITTCGIENETINLAGAESISILEIADECIKLAFNNDGTKILKCYRPERKDDFRNQDVSIEKMKKLTGWFPTRIFNQELAGHFDWLNAMKVQS